MSDLKLYELADARDIIDLWLDEHEGEETPELAELLAELQGTTTKKVEACALYIQELEANTIACREEAKRLTARAAAKATRADGLRAYLTRELERLCLKKVDGERIAVTRQNNSQASIKCDDLAAAWTTEMSLESCAGSGRAMAIRRTTESVTTFALNRDELTRRFDAGEPLPPGVTVTRGQHVRLK